jgi:squalene-hopene/tetraprenyl-beta-curcumene cyclase
MLSKGHRPGTENGRYADREAAVEFPLVRPTLRGASWPCRVLTRCGRRLREPAVRKARAFLLKTQCRNGAWWSRWWAGYLAGAGYVLRACGPLGLRLDRDAAPGDRLVQRWQRAMTLAVHFIVERQNPDGGWGETVRADSDARCAGRGKSTPLHTAHVTSALLRAGYPADSSVISNAMEYLLQTMSPDGTWNDGQWTFTAVARSHYLPFEFLNYVLPLDALTDYLQAHRAEPAAFSPLDE